MPSMKSIKRRTKSVSATKKIMKAMNMVSASKLQKATIQLNATRPLFNEASRIIGNLKYCANTVENIFVKPPQAKQAENTAYIVITSDRGLCGSFNKNVAEKALSHMEKGKNEHVIAIGLKGRDYFRRRGKNILHSYAGILETAFYEDAVRIGGVLASLYTSGVVEEAYLAYTQFESTFAYVPRLVKILPISIEPGAVNKDNEMKYEQDVNYFLDHAIPMYLSAFIYAALAETLACEQAARMMSMDSAVKNASDIIDKLTRTYNRRRQAYITQEISEIVRGANIS